MSLTLFLAIKSSTLLPNDKKLESLAAKSVSELSSTIVAYVSVTVEINIPSAATLEDFFSAFNALFDLNKSSAF